MQSVAAASPAQHRESLQDIGAPKEWRVWVYRYRFRVQCTASAFMAWAWSLEPFAEEEHLNEQGIASQLLFVVARWQQGASVHLFLKYSWLVDHSKLSKWWLLEIGGPNINHNMILWEPPKRASQVNVKESSLPLKNRGFFGRRPIES